jgi:membrane-bound lytic murein transglycosylase D
MRRYEGIFAAFLAPVLLLCSCSLDLGQALDSHGAQAAPALAATQAEDGNGVASDTAAPTPSAPVVHVSPLLAGLPAYEVARIQAEAKRVFAPIWPRISDRSRFVRARLLDVLDRLDAPPGLQLVPVVESGYNPYALSQAGALGLWQLMPGTARVLGVRRVKGFDGRRHVEVSTDAAARYLLNLHEQFGNWPLAFAAYHDGPGAVARRIARHPWHLKDDIDSMPVPEVTRTYVRHILGLAALAKMGVLTFPAPYVTRPLNVQAPVDLTKLAHTAGVDIDELFRLNPGLDRSQYFHGEITLQLTEEQLARLGDDWEPEGPKSIRVAVRTGDSLWSLARAHHTSVASIRRLNPGISRVLHIGDLVWVPANRLARAQALPNPLLARGRRIHYRVRAGDSLWTIASRFGTSPHAIARINQISMDTVIRPGDRLWILAHLRPS